eukprot:CAMPEP_0194775514 /NCGR_PEP_ID=MMETSP0323_2-20130528/60596_1 /TAXON_ID=2866 ORGANISM="Crypthecodinium cohnii, Strain Seligo" /NCGR_SAMPLE_ID=MMETSP0323_2 /ASSEMBLY_ACC=CAM_ASM_000346 /LENGTH=108 /DNA_ID=CAMNT_0039711531 /DNA_START=100 /DNA_END=423 /DNA_ORIENTATION=+
MSSHVSTSIIPAIEIDVAKVQRRGLGLRDLLVVEDDPGATLASLGVADVVAAARISSDVGDEADEGVQSLTIFNTKEDPEPPPPPPPPPAAAAKAPSRSSMWAKSQSA